MSVIDDAVDEMGRQDDKWGADRVLPDGTGPRVAPLKGIYNNAVVVLGIAGAEDLANAAKDSIDELSKRLGIVAWADILLEEVFEALAEKDNAKLRAELVQVAAVALQWAKAIDKRG